MKGQLYEAVLVPCPLQSKTIETGVVIFVFYVKILSCYWSLRGDTSVDDPSHSLKIQDSIMP